MTKMDLFSELFSMFDGFEGMFNMDPMPKESKVCPICGSTAEDINRSGRFGCGECYNVFRDGAERTLRQIQPRSEHCGKVPSKAGVQVKVKRRLAELKAQLKTAVANEEYETAAKLHSEIKKLEGGAL